MEGTPFSSYSRVEPFFKVRRLSPAQHLSRERVRLIRDLPLEHTLRTRVQRHTGTLIASRSATGIPREAFTEDELKSIKLRRKTTAPDQNEARVHLQEINLLNMWNSDCKTEEQWAEYDSVQTIMEDSKTRSTIPREAFHPDTVVGAKRKRVVSDEKRTVRTKSEELEDGEIEPEEDAVQSIEEMNDELRLENESIRAFLRSKGLGDTTYGSGEPSPPASPPQSEKTESSDDESDLNVEADDDVGDLKDFADGIWRNRDRDNEHRTGCLTRETT